MLLCGVLRYCSVFVTDERRSRLLKLGFGTTLPRLASTQQATNSGSTDAPSSSCKLINQEPDILLTDEEAFYLTLHRYLVVNDLNSVQLTLDDLWKTFNEKNKQFPSKYKCFEFFRKQSYVVRPGLHYGSDYTVYKASPQMCHSELCVTVVPYINKPSESGGSNRELNWRHLSTLTRVMPDVMKLALLCYVLPIRWKKKTKVPDGYATSASGVVGSNSGAADSNVLNNCESKVTGDSIVNPDEENTDMVAPDADLQMFLQFVESLIDESNGENSLSAQCSPENSTATHNEGVSTLHRNNSLYLHDIHGTAEETVKSVGPVASTASQTVQQHQQQSQSETVNADSSFVSAPLVEDSSLTLPSVSTYIDLLFNNTSPYPFINNNNTTLSSSSSSSSSSSNSSESIDLSTYHCLDQLTVRPVTILIRRLHADATKYQTVGQMQEKYCAKSIKKVPKRLQEGGANSGGGSNKKKKRKRRDIGEVRNKSMSKTNQLWKELIVNAEDKTDPAVHALDSAEKAKQDS